MSTNNIKEAMDKQGRKQVFLQKELGRGRTTIYNWYNNLSQPNIFQLKQISELLNVSMEDLINL